MIEPLTRAQVDKAILGLLNDRTIKGNIGATTTVMLLQVHDAALRAALAAITEQYIAERTENARLTQEIKRLQSLVGDMVRVMCPGTLLDTKEGG